MRPVNRGDAPREYERYQDAKKDLVGRLGTYCSYCERTIPTNLAIEHILPKDEGLGFSHLETVWTNFLLSCVNCNSIKGTKIIQFNECFLPDRDNTFHVFDYAETGMVEVRQGLELEQINMANALLELVGLDRQQLEDLDDDILFIALGRQSQRKQAWRLAVEAREDYDNESLPIRRICSEATAHGFFSIWMAAFDGVPEVRSALINAFVGTADECFHAETTISISPRPQTATLQNSGKI